MESEHIIHVVCKTLNLDRDKLLSEDKHRPYVDGRFIGMALVRQHVKIVKNLKRYGLTENKMPYDQICYIFKKKDHATVIHAELQCKILLQTDKEFKKKYDMVVNCLDNNVNIA